MHHPETVGHEGRVITNKLDQRLRQAQPLVVVLTGLSRVEANVLQQQDVAVGKRLRVGQRVGTDHVARQLHAGTQVQRRQPLRDWRQ